VQNSSHWGMLCLVSPPLRVEGSLGAGAYRAPARPKKFHRITQETGRIVFTIHRTESQRCSANTEERSRDINYACKHQSQTKSTLSTAGCTPRSKRNNHYLHCLCKMFMPSPNHVQPSRKEDGAPRPCCAREGGQHMPGICSQCIASAQQVH